MEGSFRRRLSLSRLVGRAPLNIYDAANEESFWDDYAANWTPSPCTRTGGEFVGSEWRHQEDFECLLRRYACPNQKALEIGCGGGRITATALTLFSHVCAADISSEMLQRARQAVTAPNVSFHKLDGFGLDEFPDSSFDVVYSHDVAVQLSSPQVYALLMEAGRVLRPGGLGLVSFYDFVEQFEMFKQTSLSLWMRRLPSTHRRLHFMTEEILHRMLEDLRLDMVEAQRGRFLTLAFRKPRCSATCNHSGPTPRATS